jgi:uncharacterized membrane protein
MNDKELIIPISLLYLIVNLILHIIFFITTIFYNKYIKQINEKNINKSG